MIKVNILSGFFGSGKTTLISNIIKYENIKSKVAIIQNEFSDGIIKKSLLDHYQKWVQKKILYWIQREMIWEI